MVGVEGCVIVEYICPFCGSREEVPMGDFYTVHDCTVCCRMFVVWFKPVVEASGGYVDLGERGGKD